MKRVFTFAAVIITFAFVFCSCGLMRGKSETTEIETAEPIVTASTDATVESTTEATTEEPLSNGDFIFTFNAENSSYSVKAANSDISGDIVIPQKYNGLPVTAIAEDAFHSCKNIRSVKIPNGVTSIGDRAFYFCTSLKSITIPRSVMSIGNYVIEFCMNLESITFQGTEDMWYQIDKGRFWDADTEYYEILFSGDSEETTVETTEATTEATTKTEEPYPTPSPDRCFKFILNDDGKSYSVSAAHEYISGNIVIPKTHDGLPVTSIYHSAFYNCTKLTSITIPDSVTSIGYYAFGWCTGLTSITIPDSVTSIGELAFEGCYRLTSITIPNSVTSIGSSAFESCGRLTSITIPNSVTSIGGYAFEYCTSLTSITIPDSVTSIGSGAFEYCRSLTSITVDKNNPVYLSDGNCIIDKESKTLIVGCKASVIPDNGSVTSIGDGAFIGCTGLTSITIPDSVTYIGYGAFWDCTGLMSITYDGTKAEWKAISKGSYWDKNTPNYTIHWTDGDIWRYFEIK